MGSGGDAAGELDGGLCPERAGGGAPASRGGTLPGLGVGRARAGWGPRVAGARVTGRSAATRLRFARLATRTAALLDDPTRYRPADISLVGGYLGPGYGEPTRLGRRVSKVAAAHGLTLDPTYTAKTVGAISGEFTDETVLYWHTLSSRRPEMLSTEAAVERLPGGDRGVRERAPGAVCSVWAAP